MLTPQEVRQLGRLSFGPSVVSPTSSAVDVRMARARGFGLEFQDYRRYQPGDDPRSIDWTIHTRLRQLVVRVFRSDAHLRVHLLVDTSGSMGVGVPGKLSCATRVAAALCYIAVRRRDAVGVATFDATVRRYIAPAAGRAQLLRVFETLGAAAPGGQSATDRALVDYGTAVRGPGLAVVMSDFFQDGGAFKGLRYLLHRGLTPAVVQVVAPEELNPAFDDDVELVDIEDPEATPLLVNRGAIAAYRERMATLSAELREFCFTHAVPWMRVESSFAFTQLLHASAHAGLLNGQG
jgi:uncharacterized protein (DUF58 family)